MVRNDLKLLTTRPLSNGLCLTMDPKQPVDLRKKIGTSAMMLTYSIAHNELTDEKMNFSQSSQTETNGALKQTSKLVASVAQLRKGRIGTAASMSRLNRL